MMATPTSHLALCDSAVFRTTVRLSKINVVGKRRLLPRHRLAGAIRLGNLPRRNRMRPMGGLSEVIVREFDASHLCHGPADCVIDAPVPCGLFFRKGDVDR